MMIYPRRSDDDHISGLVLISSDRLDAFGNVPFQITEKNENYLERTTTRCLSNSPTILIKYDVPNGKEFTKGLGSTCSRADFKTAINRTRVDLVCHPWLIFWKVIK